MLEKKVGNVIVPTSSCVMQRRVSHVANPINVLP